jgi:hypothetical protein
MKSEKEAKEALMSNDVLLQIDPVLDSKKYLLVILFAKSSSPSYYLAVGLAKNAAVYNDVLVENKVVHFAAFAKNVEDANKAITIIDYLCKTKTLQVFCNGKIVNHINDIRSILDCYIKACSCNDIGAHCKCVIEDPFKEKALSSLYYINLQRNEAKPIEIQRYVFPCTYLKRFFRFQIDHPSSIEDQIQASAVENYCEWCPNLSPSSFEKLPKKIVFPDGTEIYEKEQTIK